ncbi:hypothetical protein Tco_0455477 [Tanacetum coccineum]
MMNFVSYLSKKGGEGEEKKRKRNRARKKQGPTSQDPSRRAPQAEMSIVPIELETKSAVAIVDGASRGDLYFVVPRGLTTGCTKQTLLDVLLASQPAFHGFGTIILVFAEMFYCVTVRGLEIHCTEFLQSLPDIFFVKHDPFCEHLLFLDIGIIAKKQG